MQNAVCFSRKQAYLAAKLVLRKHETQVKRILLMTLPDVVAICFQQFNQEKVFWIKHSTAAVGCLTRSATFGAHAKPQQQNKKVAIFFSINIMSVYAVPYQSLMYLIILNRMCYHKGYCYASVCAFHFVPVDNGCCQHNLLFYNIERTFADVGRSEFLTVQLKSLRQRFYSKLSAFSNKKLFF